MNLRGAVLFNDSEFEDLRGWGGSIDTPDATVYRDGFATPGEAVDALHRWAHGRGHLLTLTVFAGSFPGVT